MRRANYHAPILAFLFGSALFFSGCSIVTKHIETSTGNQIEKVKLQVTQEDAESKEETDANKDKTKPPTSSRSIQDIVNDDGEGRYSGEKYNEMKVLDSLRKMPKGTNEQVYKYLLGLVGEGYKEKMEGFQETYQPNYQSMIDQYRKVGTQQPPLPNPPPPVPPVKLTHVTILMDASSSMAEDMNGKRKIDLVKEKVLSFIGTLPKEAIVTLKVYGHMGSNKKQDKAVSCQGDGIVYQGPAFMREQLQAALQQIDAKGYSPLAKALETPDNLVLPPNTEQKIIILADGTDNCDGDVKGTIQNLQETKQAKVDVIAIRPSKKEKKSLQTLSEETGGGFEQIQDDQQLQQALDYQKQSIALAQRPWQEQALEEVTHEYRSANNDLTEQYQDVDATIETEHQRLAEANSYILDQKMIEQNDYLQIQGWIDQRRLDLKTYSEKQWQEAGNKLDADYEKYSQQIVQETQPPAFKKVEERKNQLAKELDVDKIREEVPKIIQDEVPNVETKILP